MSDEKNNSVDDILDDLFANTKSNVEQVVELPSRGLGYPGKKGKVTIRTMTFEDEIALSEATPDQDVVDLMLTRCVSDIDPDILYAPDRIFLLFKIRELSYGNSIKLSGPCTECTATNHLDIDLSKLEVVYVDDSFKDPKHITLPDMKKKIQIRIPRASDNPYLLNKKKILDNLWRFIVKLDKYVDPKIISSALERMSSKDIRVIIESLLEGEFGLQNKARYICSDCRAENILEVPLSQAFFTVS